MPDEMVTTYEHVYTPTDRRLGRHVRHDSRSLRHAVGVLPRSAIKAVSWTRRIPILDQGQIGDCVPNALTGILGTDSEQRTGLAQVTVKADPGGVFQGGPYPLNESFAVRLYSLITALDSYPGQYPPDDTGSDALGAMAAAQALGLAGEYQHAFSYTAAQSAVQKGPLMWGTEWLESMFDTDRNGFLVVDRKSGVAGGHELVLSGYDPDTDVWQADNSWGTSWGADGRASVTGVNLRWLLTQEGDITLPTWITSPVTPPGPAPFTDAEFWEYAQQWAAGKGFTS